MTEKSHLLTNCLHEKVGKSSKNDDRTAYHLPKGIKQQKVKRILATPSDDVGKLAAYYDKRKWI